MNWYYVEQGQQAGALTDEQFDEMVRSGKILPDTLVWHEGMAAWSPCREVKGGIGSTGLATATASEVICAECGKTFPVDETISYGNARVCAACKPIFLQKLKEGAAINTGEMNYARILTRFAAMLLDALILGGINMILGMLLGVVGAAATRNNPGAFIGIQLVLFAIELAIGVSYEGFMVGKMACKIKVVTADGGRVSYGRAFGRYFAKMLSSLTCLIGYIIAIFDNPQKRALHDHICSTRVVYR